MISKSRIALRVLLILTLMLAFFTCTAYAAAAGHDEINANGKPYGADFKFDVVSGDLQSVRARLIKAYYGENVDLPSVVTIDGTDYNVVSLKMELDNYDDLNGTFTVPDDLRTIEGNLFDWQKLTQRDFKADGYYMIDYSYCNVDVPDTETMLDGIPECITMHYEDGAYYAGKCLVKVDPYYNGNFEVKDGTVCILASAFEGCGSIDAVTLPDSVEFIGTRAFANSSVSSVNLPSGLMEGESNNIPCLTFYNCSELTTVTFDEGVELKSIGYCAFCDCVKLTGFDFGKAGSLHMLSFAGAFDPSKNVSVSLRPEQIASSGGQFSRSGINSVSFLENVGEYQPGWEYNTYTTVTFCSFYSCENLESVDLGTAVTRLHSRCFENCTGITDDILSAEDCAVTYLDYRCLAGTGLTEITIPKSVTGTGGGLFHGDTSLETLNIYAEHLQNMFSLVNDCGAGSFCSKTMTSLDLFTSAQPDPTGRTCIKTIHVYVQPLKLGSILKEMPYLEEVYFHNNAEDEVELCSNMLQFSPALTTVGFDHPEKITLIGSNAFLCCPNLTDFPFTEMTGLKSIQNNAFMLSSKFYDADTVDGFTDARQSYGFSGTVDLTACKDLTYIGQAAFENQYHITEVKLPKDAVLRSSAFDMCSSIKSVSTEGSLLNLSYDVLSSTFYIYGGNGTNHKIESITAGDTEAIPKGYFSEMISLKSVSITGVKKVGDRAFRNTGIEEIVLPEVEEIGISAFSACKNLKTVTVPGGAVIGRYAFGDCVALTDVVIEDGITELGWEAFADCPSLENVALPVTLERLSWAAFKDCPKLNDVRVPAGVKVIEDDAFALSYTERDEPLRILFEGTPELFETELDAESYEAKSTIIWNDENPRNLPDGSTVYYVEEDMGDCLETLNDEGYLAVEMYCIDGLTMSGAPETVVAGRELDLSEFEIKCGNTVLTEDQYTLDYDPSDKTLGLRTVTVTCPDLPEAYGDRVVIAGPGLTEDEISGNSFIVSVPDSTQFAVKVVEAYKITVTDGTADKEEAAEGETVTVKADSKSGYKFKTWTVVSENVELENDTAAETTFVMPAEDVELKAEFKKKSTGGSSSGPKPEEKEKFDDVPKDAYYHDPVYWAVDKGITEGTSPTTFSPMAPTTRADFVTFLWRAAGSPKVSGDMPFEDVPEGAYYHDAVLWAYQKGITEGTTPTTFRPDWTVTRGQAVTFLHRNAGEPEVGDTNPFTDVEETDYYYAPILWAVEKKIVEGTTPTTFSPDRDSYRAEVVTMLYRELAE